MITSKYIAAITVTLLCLSLIICGLFVYAADTFDTDKIPEYQTKLFGDEIATIDIQVEADDWQSLLDNAQAKEWISGDLVINGEQYNMVGIRTKGNSSLSMGTMGNSSDGRYSLQFKFNKYVKGQTCFGLDSFCINNLMGDTTYMKDYISYEIMDYIGVETPLANYASVTVNGEDYGFCLALERYDKSFLDRVYSTSGGQLYNVKNQMGMGEDFEDMGQDIESVLPGREKSGSDSGGRQSAGDTALPGGDFSQGRGMGLGGFGGNGGGSLVYTDDEISSYGSIFDNAVFGGNSDYDKQRVITAIKNLNAGTDLEKYFDVDEILRYFAAHTVVVNLDSYISNMQQNYYIYERDGKITILPWDYGLAFGGFMSGSASSVVNFPIETPVSGVNMEDRPLLNKLLEVDEYKERYHEYLGLIVEGYFENGLFEDTINSLDAKIGEYVKNDVSAYYTYEQYKESLPELIELGRLRAKSIKGQLDGTVPSTSSGQTADSSSLIDASSVNLSALGSMMGGMGQGGGQDKWNQGGQQSDGQGEMPSMPGGQGNNSQDGGFDMPGGNMPDMELIQQAMQILKEAGGEVTDEVKAALLELGLTEEQITMISNMQDGLPGGNMGQGESSNRGRQSGFPGDSNTSEGIQSDMNTGAAITVGTALIVLLGAIIFVAKPRKNMI